MFLSLFYFSIFGFIFFKYLFNVITKYFKYSLPPKGYVKIEPNNEYYEKILKKVKNITRDGYTKKKVPEKLDAIIIGSGIGGLTCGALLSNAIFGLKKL